MDESEGGSLVGSFGPYMTLAPFALTLLQAIHSTGIPQRIVRLPNKKNHPTLALVLVPARTLVLALVPTPRPTQLVSVLSSSVTSPSTFPGFFLFLLLSVLPRLALSLAYALFCR